MQIAQHLPEIIQLIGSNPVVSIVANTGSGKSVGIPAAIAGAGAKCFVVVPTRTAAISLAEYQRVLQHNADPTLDVIKLIGYAAEGNINYGPETKIAYVTGGHMRKKMLSYFSEGTVSPIDFCDVILADEVHSGSLDNTLIISLWMTAATSGVKVPRLVIASATPVPMLIRPEPVVYQVDSVAFPIEYRYLQKDIDIDDPEDKLYTETSALAADIHRNTDIDTGHILIFAPGSSEVENIASSLNELLEVPIPGKKVEIISAFGALKPEDIALIYKQTGKDERKIVIATNIAEMSITIGDVGHVIDTMVEKRAETSQSGGFRLSTHYISKDSAKQRAGRTGRTRPGICYRMCTQQRYDGLEEHRPPEIDRVPIYEMVMELLDVGLSPETVLQGVDSQRISNAIYLLIKLGMVEKTGNKVTEIGHFAPNFPLSVRNAGFLWKWIDSGYPIFPGIITAALIDCYGPSYFWLPRRRPTQAPGEYNTLIRDYKTKYFTKYLGYNDLESSLNMWNDLASTIGGIHAPRKTLLKWSRTNSINNKKISELLKIVQQSINTAIRLGFEVQIGPFTTQGVMNASRPLLLSTYSDMTLIQRRDSSYFSPITKEDYRLDNRDAINKLAEKYPPGIIALVTAEIKSQRGTFRVISFGVDTEIDGLGRPIVIKNKPSTPRTKGGYRSITRGKQTSVQPQSLGTPQDFTNALDTLSNIYLDTSEPSSNSEITDALASLSDMYISTTELSSDADITNALDLLTGINTNTLDLGMPQLETYNPPLVIEHIQHNNIRFNLIQDTHLQVGTKQRGLNYFLELQKVGYTEIVTYDELCGYDMIVIAWCCQSAGLSCHIFVPVSRTSLENEIVNSAMELSASIYEIDDVNILSQSAQNLAQDRPTAIFIEPGLDDPNYIQYLGLSIQQVAPQGNPINIWTSDSVVARALALIYPESHICIVQIDKIISRQPFDDAGINFDVYVAPEAADQPASITPPYDSLPNTNAKVWQFVQKYGMEGDYIWNIK